MTPVSYASMSVSVNRLHQGFTLMASEEKNNVSEFSYNIVYYSFLKNTTVLADSGHCTLIRGDSVSHPVFVVGLLRVLIDMELDGMVLLQHGLIIGSFYVVLGTDVHWRYV